MRDLEPLFAALAKSSFRRRFQLQGQDRDYLLCKGWPIIAQHARDFIDRRLAPVEIANDGKQTPYRGHPVFVAQHATACCCRGCLHQWYGIPPGIELTTVQREYIVSVLLAWLRRQTE